MTRRGRSPGSRRPAPLAHAARVAAFAAALIGVVFAAATVIFDLVDSGHLVSQVDARLGDALGDAARHPVTTTGHRSGVDDGDIEAAPVVFWTVAGTGRAAAAISTGVAPLPAGTWPSAGRPATATVGGRPFRLRSATVAGRVLVAGESLADTHHTERVVANAEIVAGPVVVAAAFLGAVLIGLQASRPIEQARVRQLEFTADASHELRTPLSVIDAEVELALGSRRDAAGYREALERVDRETHRLRRLVEDLLWLARFDSAPPRPGDEPVDLATVVEGCVDRFSAVARSRGVDLTFCRGDEPALITAPPDWVDRMAGVLLDNASRYAGAGGTVAADVTAHAGRVVLTVDDSGPGIPAAERPRLFDRFHRATDEGTGAGLGLAIADAVVRSTGGRWYVGDSPLGGARLQVAWRWTTAWRSS